MEHKLNSPLDAIASVEATEAESNFGALIEKAQQEPVVIIQHGRKSSVIMSSEEFALYREFKLQRLRAKLARSEEQARRGEFSDATPEDIMRAAKLRYEQEL